MKTKNNKSNLIPKSTFNYRYTNNKPGFLFGESPLCFSTKVNVKLLLLTFSVKEVAQLFFPSLFGLLLLPGWQ